MDGAVRPVASLGCDLPLELLAATGRFAGPLAFDAERPTPWAERWLESKFAPWTFQILEDWASGALDHLGEVVFSRGDDSCQRLYYYVCELRRTGRIAGPEPLIFDLGHIPRASSAGATVEAVRRLAGRLEVTEAALAEALSLAPPAETAPPGLAGCVLAGTLPPDRRVHAAVERSGWAAHGRTLPESWQTRAVPLVEEGGDAFERLGRRLHAAREGPRAFDDRIAALLARIGETGSRAAILWFCEHDEAEVWHAPAMRRALDEAGIPNLILTRRDWRLADGAADEIAAFLTEQGQ